MSLNDEDPIVREIDVFLNRLEEQGDTDIYLLQYPLRPVYRPYGDHGQLCLIERASASRRLKLTYALNVQGDQFEEGARAQVRNKHPEIVPTHSQSAINVLFPLIRFVNTSTYFTHLCHSPLKSASHV